MLRFRAAEEAVAVSNFWSRAKDLLSKRGERELSDSGTHPIVLPDDAVDGGGVGGRSAGKLLTRVSDAVTGRSYEKIEAAQQQLLSLIGSIQSHLDGQAARSEKMAGSLAQLAYALSSMPESARVQHDTLRALMQHVAAGNQRSETLGAIVDELRKAQSSQSASMQQLAEAIHAASFRTGEQQSGLSEQVRRVEGAVGVIGLTTRSQSDMLSRLSEIEQKQDQRLIDLIRKQNRRFNTLFIVTLSLAGFTIAAMLVLTVVVLLK